MRSKSRIRWVLATISGLIVWVVLAPVAGATDITVDGDCSDWVPQDYQLTDPQEAGIPDQYDISVVGSTIDGAGDLFIGYVTYSAITVNSGAYTRVWFDVDNNPNTGQPIGGYGADYRMTWFMDTGDDRCGLQEYNGGWSLVCQGDTCCNGEWGDSPTCVEIFVSGEELGLGGDTMPVGLVFYNDDTYPNDSVVWDYGLPTSVELSSFTAYSESRPPDESQLPSLWPAAILSGLLVVSAGGLVLWRGKGLAR